jgi:hypothetical protein
LRTSTYTTYVDRLCALVGISRDTLTSDEDAQFLGWFNKNVRGAWESFPWPELTRIEQRTPDANLVVALDQPGQAEIESVIELYKDNPLASASPRRVGWTLTSDGIQLVGQTSAESVYVYFRTVCPESTGLDGDTFPYLFLNYVVYAGYADWLLSDGQNDKYAQAVMVAGELLRDEIEKYERQQRFIPETSVRTHLTSRPL